MSFSICTKCGTMVCAYEKYCDGCVSRYGVKQDLTFHKRQTAFLTKEQKVAEFEKDVAQLGDNNGQDGK